MGLLHPKTRQKQCQVPLLERKKKNDKQLYWTLVIGGVVTPKDKAAEARPLANTILKRNLLSCLIKQNIRCIVFKYFLTATYYCSIIAIITSKRKVICNMRIIMAISYNGSIIFWMIYCGNKCKLLLLK